MWEDEANANGVKRVLTMKNNATLPDRCWSWLAMVLVDKELEDGSSVLSKQVATEGANLFLGGRLINHTQRQPYSDFRHEKWSKSFNQCRGVDETDKENIAPRIPSRTYGKEERLNSLQLTGLTVQEVWCERPSEDKTSVVCRVGLSHRVGQLTTSRENA
jgi:hypothetical protein